MHTTKQHHDEYNAPLSHNGINTCFAITPCLLSVPCWSATFTVSSGWSCDRIPSRAASEHTNVIYPTKPIIHNYPLSNYPSPKTNIVNGAHCYHTYCSSWKLRLCRRIASECMMVISSGQCVSVVSLFIGSVLLWSSGKRKGKGSTQEVNQRSFIDYRLSIIDIFSLELTLNLVATHLPNHVHFRDQVFNLHVNNYLIRVLINIDCPC